MVSAPQHTSRSGAAKVLQDAKRRMVGSPRCHRTGITASQEGTRQPKHLPRYEQESGLSSELLVGIPFGVLIPQEQVTSAERHVLNSSPKLGDPLQM